MQQRARSHARTLGIVATGLALVAVTGGSALAQDAPEVIRTIQNVTIQGPWYQYDKDQCTFVEVPEANAPTEYASELKKMDGTTLVYTPEGQTEEFDKILNTSLETSAKDAGMTWYQFSDDYPDTELPITNADQAVTVEADVVISGNVLSDLYPQIQAKYEAACIPFLNQYAVPGTVNVPRFQADNYVTGATEAAAAAKIITARGWPIDQIQIVTCTDPAVTTEAGTVYDINRGFRETLVELLGMSTDQIVATDLVCTPELGPEKARAAMADWLTANPDVKYVVGTTHIDDIYSLGLATALRDAGFAENALVVGRGGGSAWLKLMASGDPIAGVSGNPDFPSWGDPIVAMAQDIALGKPVPYLVSPPVAAVTAENVADYLPQ